MTRPAPIVDSSSPIGGEGSIRHHNGLILLIGTYHLLKATLFFAIGIGAIRLVHKDIVDIFTRAALELRFDPEGRFISLVLDKIALVNDHRLRQIGAAVFAYATLSTVEGMGLIFERAWAEYLTLILTASFLPWEFFELIHHITRLKVGLTLINVAMVLYLGYHTRKRHGERKTKAWLPDPRQS